jgi:hypothetical protein
LAGGRCSDIAFPFEKKTPDIQIESDWYTD